MIQTNTGLDEAQDAALYLSVIVPIYNEEENLVELVDRILAAVEPMQKPFELILIDDGSSDKSPEMIAELAAEREPVRGILFRRNFGQSAAMTAGFQHARGEVVVSLDGDLQNEPGDIPMLAEKLEEGYDIVCGWRKNRQDGAVNRKLPSKIANWLIGRTTKVTLHDYGCSLKAYRRDLIENIVLYGELHRFIPVLASFQGAKIAEVVTTHHPRTRGVSKYGIGRAPRVAIDLFMMYFFQRFATRPLQFFGRWGGGMFAVGVAIELYLSFLKIFLGQDIGNRPLLLLGAMLIMTGVILFSTGLLAEMVMRTYYEASGKRIYSVRRQVG